MTKTSIYTTTARAVPAAALRALHDMPDHLLRDIGLARGRF